MPNDPVKVLYESRFLRLLRRGHWEWAQRTKASGAAVIVALTKENCILFAEQFRIPVDCRVIEFPAGIIGDEDGQELESRLTAAQRELLEETGYEAAVWKECFTGASSAGMTDEVTTFFVARELKKIQPGGGIDSEDITIHEIPLAHVEDWLAEHVRQGGLLDARLFTGLYLLRRELGAE